MVGYQKVNSSCLDDRHMVGVPKFAKAVTKLHGKHEIYRENPVLSPTLLGVFHCSDHFCSNVRFLAADRYEPTAPIECGATFSNINIYGFLSYG